MPIVDPFAGSSFNTTSLTASINALEVPRRRIEELGVFPGKGIRTRSLLVEEKTGTLSLIANRPVGSPSDSLHRTSRPAACAKPPHSRACQARLSCRLSACRSRIRFRLSLQHYSLARSYVWGQVYLCHSDVKIACANQLQFSHCTSTLKV